MEERTWKHRIPCKAITDEISRLELINSGILSSQTGGLRKHTTMHSIQSRDFLGTPSKTRQARVPDLSPHLVIYKSLYK